MKLIAFFTSLAAKAAIDQNDPAVKAIMEDPSIKDVEINDDVAGKINSALMTLSAAESNPTLREKLIKIGRAEAYNGMDDEIKATMDELGVTDDIRTKILEEKSTTKRASLLAKEVKRIEKETGAKPDSTLTEQVNTLNKKISDLQKAHNDAIAAVENDYKGRLLNKDIEFDLSKFNYIFPEQTPLATVMAAAKASLQRAMSEQGVKVVETETGSKKLVRLDGTDYYDAQNKSVAYNEFIAAALAADNLLKAKDAKGPEHQSPPPPVPGNQGFKPSQSFIESADSDLQMLENALK